jgi:hypothetical protein
MAKKLSNQDVTGTVNVSGDLSTSGKLSVNASAGDEGGEIFLNKSVTNTTISGGVTVDIYQNKLRFFEQGGTARGAYIDITAASAGVATNLLDKVSQTNGTVTTAASGSGVVRNIYTSTSAPSGGSDGDVWMVYV